MGGRGRRIGTGLEGTLWATLALAMGCFACGQDENRSERVASMVATPAEEVDSKAKDLPPVIESIELDPKRPVAGARVRAKARLAASPGRKAQVSYQWQTSSGRALGRGPVLETKGLDPGSVVEVLATPEDGEKTGETLAHRFRLAAEASQIALVVIDARAGKSVGSVLRAVVETTDESDGFDAARLEWRIGGKRVGEEDELDTAPFAPGDVVELRAFPDGESEGRRGIHAEPIVLERGAPPEITSTPSSGIEGGQFRYGVAATSPVRGAELQFELLKGPQGMTVDPTTGVVLWRPATAQRGRFDVEVAVKDQWGTGVAQGFSISADSRGAPPAAAQ